MKKVSKEDFYAMTHSNFPKPTEGEIWLHAKILALRDEANEHIVRHEWDEAIECMRQLQAIDHRGVW